MARTRAADYDEKRRGILDQSARLFAQHGYDRASLAMIAQACGMSKALLYHYYSDKADVLFDIIRLHLERLLERTAEAEQTTTNHAARLVALATTLLEEYRDADAEHQVQLTALRLLPQARQEELRTLQKLLVARFAACVSAALPGLLRTQIKPLTMSLFGMLNWCYLWFDESGPMTRTEYARLAVQLVLQGGRAPKKGQGSALDPPKAEPLESIT